MDHLQPVDLVSNKSGLDREDEDEGTSASI